jgi:hypothetical protein
MDNNYDWSILDRDLLTEITALSAHNIVNQQLSPIELSARIRRHLRFFKVPVHVVSSYHKETNKQTVWVGGLYHSGKDQVGQTAITVRLQYNPSDKHIKLNRQKFRRVCLAIADTILHEIIHMRQYRRRCFKSIPGYESIAESRKQHTEQTYLGHYDEIDAYSFNIACMLGSKFKNNINQIADYLNSELSDKRLVKNSYRTYLKAFDHNHNHAVIKKLKKKIMYYLPYAKLGKPYKTSNWLRA